MKKDNELAHGRWLSENHPEAQWNWTTPAGKLRFARRVKNILSGIPAPTPGYRILEIGCGTGMFTAEFAKTGADITAVELSPDLLALAEKRFATVKREPGGRVQFICAPFEECMAGGPFDAIIGSSVLHHLDCAQAFPKIFAMLVPGGRMSFCEPNILNPQVWAERKFRRFFPYTSPDEIAFYAPSLRAELLSVGFSEVDIEPFDWLHPSVPEKLIGPVKFLEKILERTPGVRQFAGSLRISATKPV